MFKLGIQICSSVQCHELKHLAKYMFYAFMLVFCVLATKILNGVVPSIADEGVWVCRASLEKFVCEEVYESADGGHLKLCVKIWYWGAPRKISYDA